MSENEQKPREWTIFWSTDGEIGSVHRLGIAPKERRTDADGHDDYSTDVIEKSAYDNLKAKNERLRTTLERIKNRNLEAGSDILMKEDAEGALEKYLKDGNY